MAEGGARGMPLLSGPPPEVAGETHCRNCCKEFNVLFTRSKRCYHCGYSYCQSSGCGGHQALMPKTDGTGYEVEPVCGLCIDMLMITASGKGHLRQLPLAKLRNYCHAYNIQLGSNTLEKDDLIDKIIAARMPNGCLPPAHETYYRQHSVPDNPGDRLRARSNFFNPSSQQQPQRPPAQQPASAPTTPSRGPAPPPPPSGPPPFRRPQAPAPTPPPAQTRPQSGWNPFQRTRAPSPPPRSTPTSRPVPPPRPATTAPRPPARPAPASPPPTLDALLAMSEETLAALSIGTLKAVLADNHVNARMLLEKADLVAKVCTLVENERRDRARAEEMREIELHEERERQMRIQAEIEERQRRAREGTIAVKSDTDVAKTTSPGPVVPADRPGLCVVCQDDESCIAIIDCGHLCMCRACSDLVMNSTRECPLCRTRIVTDARLLRIYRT